MKCYRLIVVVLSTWFIVGVSYAQIPDLSFRYFNQKEGLSNTFVTSIAQDSSGYIWVGTINGLNRFDGFSFQSYYPNSKDSTQLNNGYVNDLYVDKADRLWISTENGLHT